MEARSMDRLSVHHNGGGISKPCHGGGKGGGGGGKGSRGGGGKGIKVVYISSPMKLTASAEEFRAVVQELTGRDSNVADHDLDHHHHHHQQQRYHSSSSSFGRASMMMPAAAAGGVVPRSCMPPTMATANAAGAGRMMMATADATGGGAAGVMATAAPKPFQSVYDHGSLLYGQDYW
uniref:VQ domain-containing protein n=1 Tax=Oryza nivara TaxID=4536 RepID=A0A0E0GLM8_ORYNI